MTDAWDPSIPWHKELAHQIEFGNGIPEMRPISKAREALRKVGFVIEHEEDLAERPDLIPWYYPLEGDISKAQTLWDYLTVWRMSWSGKLVTHNAVRVMEWVGMLPKGTFAVGESLKVAGDSLVRGGQTKVNIPRFVFSNSKANCYRTALHAHVSCHLQEASRLEYPSIEFIPRISRSGYTSTYLAQSSSFFMVLTFFILGNR
jgi:Sterol methyltransferase C-terminal